MIVEGQGIGLWTRVRLPPNPLQSEASNTYPINKIAVFRNIFFVIIDMKGYHEEEKATETKITFAYIRRYVSEHYNLKISNSTITQIVNKCGLNSINLGQKINTMPSVKSEKEKVVLEVFKELGIVAEA